MSESETARRVQDILAHVKPLAAEYYQLTDKPLGVTGVVAEYLAAEALGLELVPPRTNLLQLQGPVVEQDEQYPVAGRAPFDGSQTLSGLGDRAF